MSDRTDKSRASDTDDKSQIARSAVDQHSLVPNASHAIALAVGSAVLFGLMGVTIRLASADVHAFEIAFFRNLFGLLFALPLLYRVGFGVLKTDRIQLYLLRCGIGLCAMLTGFWSLVHLPLAQAVALSFTTPLFVTIGAVLVSHETVRARRWSAVIIGFVGALIILKPWQNDLQALASSGALIALVSAVFSASAAISIKFLTRTEAPEAIVIYMVLIMTPLSLIPALMVWTWPSPASWGYLLLTGALGTAAHVLLTRAYQLGDVSALTPLNFLQLPVVAVAGWYLFAEYLDRYTLLGSGLIFASTLYIAHRERVLRKHVTLDPNAKTHEQVSR
jgi:drug/metabolite transporter (DMT)-like permease